MFIKRMWRSGQGHLT